MDKKGTNQGETTGTRKAGSWKKKTEIDNGKREAKQDRRPKELQNGLPDTDAKRCTIAKRKWGLESQFGGRLGSERPSASRPRTEIGLAESSLAAEEDGTWASGRRQVPGGAEGVARKKRAQTKREWWKLENGKKREGGRGKETAGS